MSEDKKKVYSYGVAKNIPDFANIIIIIITKAFI